MFETVDQVGENAEFERQYLQGELEVELTPQVKNPHQISLSQDLVFFW